MDERDARPSPSTMTKEVVSPGSQSAIEGGPVGDDQHREALDAYWAAQQSHLRASANRIPRSPFRSKGDLGFGNKVGPVGSSARR